MTKGQWTGSSVPYISPNGGDVWGREAASQGRSGGQRILFAGEVTAPETVAQALGLEVGESVILRRRVIHLDGVPVELADSYWPLSVAAGTALAAPGKVKGGAPTLLAELGYTAADVQETVRAREATSAEREALEMTDPSEWVLTLHRVIAGGNSQPYEVFVSVAPGRFGQLNYSMKAS